MADAGKNAYDDAVTAWTQGLPVFVYSAQYPKGRYTSAGSIPDWAAQLHGIQQAGWKLDSWNTVSNQGFSTGVFLFVRS